MFRRLSLLWIALAIVCTGMVAPRQAQAGPLLLTRLVPRWASDLHTDGSFVIWSAPDNGTPPQPYGLYALALPNGEPMRIGTNIATSAGSRGNVAISNGMVVWIEDTHAHRRLQAQNLRGGAPIVVASGDIGFPSISGTTVTWWEDYAVRDEATARKPATLKSRDIGTMGEPKVLAQTSKLTYGFGPSYAGDHWITYAKATGAGKATACWALEAVPIGGGTPTQIGDLGCAPPKFDLTGDQLWYVKSDGVLVTTSLGSGQMTQSGPHGSANLTGESRYALWSKPREIAPGKNTYDLWGFDSSTESAFVVAAGTSGDIVPSHPATRGGVVAWFATGAETSTTLHVARLHDVLPTARRDGPQGGQIFFPEVGHTLGGSFRTFWERNGGLPVFGYPLTEEFVEKSRDTGQGYAVQYLERQRYELHPENVNTPYEVLLGRLGAEALQRAGRNWQSEPKANPAAPHYFAATGHAVAEEFWSYWRNHGLELGDAGMSEREALALFGFPITEPKMETNSSGHTVLTQWFERARFEYHPNNPAGYRVLLGRLSADMLAERAW